MLYKIGVLKNFAKLTGKHLHGSLFSNTVAKWRSFSLKKRLLDRCFPVNFAKILRARFYRTSPATASEM